MINYVRTAKPLNLQNLSVRLHGTDKDDKGKAQNRLTKV